MYAPRSKPDTSEANVVGNVRASKCVIGPMAVRPATDEANNSATLCPSGEITPIPVMTTRLLIAYLHFRRQETGVRRQGRICLLLLSVLCLFCPLSPVSWLTLPSVE